MTYRHLNFWPLAAALALSLTACGDEAEGEAAQEPCELTLPQDGEPFDKLSDYCFFQGDLAEHTPSEGVYAYGVNTKLYSDKSQKLRFFVLPEGEKIGFNETEKWDFPVGTVLVKTFYYPNDARSPEGGRQILETRLLVKKADEWDTEVYRWNEDQTDAEHYLIGQTVDVEWIDEDGESQTVDYKIPAKSDCKSCHNHNDKITLLGPRTRQLNMQNDYGDGPINQITYFDQQGLLDGAVPPVDTLPKLIDPKDETQPLELRARTYLEGNCAHCHSEGGPARNSALFLSIDEEDPYHWGVCKTPIAAGGGTGGRPYDIYPGKPERSIMLFRMNSNDPEIKMPELPLRTIDEFGVNLVTEWVTNMEGTCAPE